MEKKSDSLLGRVAWLYYEQDMSQKEIADFIGTSRIKVVRMIKEAKAKGIVEFHINEKHIRWFELEDKLQRATGLNRVVVIPTGPDIFACLGSGALLRFKQALTSCKSIALGGGRTIQAMVNRAPKVKKLVTEQVVSMGEFINDDSLYDPSTIAHVMTTKFNVKCHKIESFSISTPVEVVKAMQDTPSVARAISLAMECDVAFNSVNAIKESGKIYYGPITPKLQKELMDAGVVGELEGTLFTMDGKCHETIFSRRACVPFPMKCPVVLVAGGIAKTAAIVGAIRGNFVNELITDSEVANQLLEYF